MRNQFEKLKSVKIILNDNPSIRFDVFLNKYVDEEAVFFNAVQFINGAWYAHQEQQKKIQAAIDLLNTPMSGTVSDLLRDLEDVLQ